MLRYLFYFAFRERFYTRVFYLFWCSKLSSQGETRATKYGATGGTKTLPGKTFCNIKTLPGKKQSTAQTNTPFKNIALYQEVSSY